MTRARALILITVIAAFACCATLATAQKTNSTIRGTVTDPSGAVVPNAEVTVINPGTGQERKATTNAEGEYVVPDVPPGMYDVRVAHPSFKQFVRSGIELHVSSTLTNNVQLTVGSASEEVTVEAAGVQVETSTGTVGNVVTGAQVRELPLNGRNFTQLTQLMPGVSPAANFDPKNKGLLAGVDFSVNGNPTTANQFLVDGGTNNDVGSNRTILIYPSIEAIQEMKVLRNSYGPEYGQASGGVVNIVTRGGSNDFHGSVFYFGRNDALNATEYFAKRFDQKTPLRRHDLGYSLGGPIVKDRAFFFWSQEWNKEKRGSFRSGSVPTVAERQGDFRVRRPDPSRPGQFCSDPTPNPALVPGGVIPTASQSPGGKLLVQLFPEPNVASPTDCNNWAQSLMSPIDFREESIRTDFKVAKAHLLSFRYTQDKWNNFAPNSQGEWGDDAYPAVESGWDQPAKHLVAKLSSTFGATAVNEFQFSWGHNDIIVSLTDQGASLTQAINTAIPSYFPDADKTHGKLRSHPVFWGGIAPYSAASGGLWTVAPWNNDQDLYTFRDDFSKVWGNHTFKVGFLASRNSKNELAGGASAAESVGFWGGRAITWGSGASTGNGLADILLAGREWGFGETQRELRAETRWEDYEFYFGDTWKAHRRLTLEYGFRWSFLREPYDENDAISMFHPSLYNPTRPASDLCNGIIIVPGSDVCNRPGFSPGTPGVGRALIENDNNAIAPRLGLAWDVFGDGSTAIRAGAGQYFQRERLNIPLNLVTNPPFAITVGGTRTLDVAPAAGTLTVAAAPAPNYAYRDPEGVLPNSWQWNFTIERALARDTKLELGYVGNRGLHLSRVLDLNGVAASQRAAFATATNNALRPYPNFGEIHAWDRSGSSNYHSLQTQLRSRMKNVDMQVSYTWSRSLSNTDITNSGSTGANTTVTDIYNLRADYGPSLIHRPHSFNASVIYNTPKLADTNGFVRNVFGDWELTTITQFASGNAITVYAGGVPGLPGGISGTGYGGNHRPNRVAGQPCRAESPTRREQWLNPAAFTLSDFQIGTIGNSPRGVCLGPGIKNVDFAIYKNFSSPFGAVKGLADRLKLQFRLEFFNLFNSAQFRSDRMGTTLSSGGSVVGNRVVWNPAAHTSPGFGRATDTRGPREIQYAVKFVF